MIRSRRRRRSRPSPEEGSRRRRRSGAKESKKKKVNNMVLFEWPSIGLLMNGPLRRRERAGRIKNAEEMKFKAFVTENGVMLLERRFLPALDKMGKVCHLLLIRDHAFYLLCGQSSAPASNNASDDADDGEKLNRLTIHVSSSLFILWIGSEASDESLSREEYNLMYKK
ncbi:hypothetical protein LINPERHAP2_LOCUS21899 [Linum perenne]